MKKITLSFDDAWVSSKKNDNILPVELFITSLKETMQIEVITQTATNCELLLKDEKLSKTEIEIKISLLLTKKLEADNKVAKYTVTECTTEEPTTKETTSEKKDEPEKTESETRAPRGPAPRRRPEPKEGDPFGLFDDDDEEEEKTVEPDKKEELNKVRKEINALIGAEEFKALVEEILKVAPILRESNAIDTLTRQCYLFSINDGCGMTTYAELLAQLFFNMDLIDIKSRRYVVEIKIPLPTRDEDVFSEVKRALASQGVSERTLIVVDISEWMSKTNDKKFREFLTYVEANQENRIVIFRVPFIEKEIINNIKRNIGDILSIRDISIVPFGSEELVDCAKNEFKKYGFIVEESAWEVFDYYIREEKNDGRFYGVNTVKKVVRDIIYKKALYNAQNDCKNLIIKKEEICAISPINMDDSKKGINLLDDFIGMESIKARVEEIVAQIEMAAAHPGLGAPSIHMRFVGNPGTGKTTVARVIGQILKEKGILRNGNFFECSGRDLCGQYIGHTAPKTATMCRDAYGSVLFIDEAYTLYRGAGTSERDFGKEAIDTLIAEMENHRSDLVVIMAGYPEEMETLMQANAGLESRMPYVIEFPNYTREQLFEIFMFMARKQMNCAEGFEEAVKQYFDELPEDVIVAKEFSNARFVRNLFERTCGKAAMRCQIGKLTFDTFTKEDFLLATSEKEFSNLMKKTTSRPLGFL